jgi:hypothetical protein
MCASNADPSTWPSGSINPLKSEAENPLTIRHPQPGLSGVNIKFNIDPLELAFTLEILPHRHWRLLVVSFSHARRGMQGLRYLTIQMTVRVLPYRESG